MAERRIHRRAARGHLWNLLTIVALVLVTLLNGAMSAQAAQANTANLARSAAPAAAAMPTAGYWDWFKGIDNLVGKNADWSVCSKNYQNWQEMAAKSSLLPSNRWSSGATMHTRLGDGMAEQVQSAVQGNYVNSTMLNLGNSIWGASISLSEMSYRMCFVQEAGLRIDSVIAPVGEALIDSGFFGMLVVFAIVMLFWRAHRTSGLDWKGVMRIIASVGLFTSMIAGAASTNVQAGTFGALSPGWWGSKINSTIAGVTAIPMERLSEKILVASSDQAPKPMLYGPLQNDPMSCDTYMKNLRTEYDSMFGGEAARFSRVPVMLDTLWQQSGLKIYRDVQFGVDSEIGRRVFCRQLDYDAEVSPTEQVEMTAKGWPQLKNWGNVEGSLAFAPTDSLSVDRSVIGWASCQVNTAKGDGSLKLVPGFDVLENEATVTATPADVPVPVVPNAPAPKAADDTDCMVWIGVSSAQEQEARGAKRTLMAESRFDWNVNSEKIAERTGIYGKNAADPRAKAINDFINAYQGHSPRASAGLLVIYVLSAAINFLVFGGIGLVILCTKVMLYVLIAMAVFQIMMALVKDSESPTRFIKNFAGIALYTVVMQSMMLLVGLVTAALNGMGSQMNPLFVVLWSALAPLGAAVGAVLLAKSVGMPNPLRPSSAFAFAGAGGAMLAGVMNRAENKTMRESSKVGRKAANAVNPLTGSGPGRSLRDSATGASALASKKNLAPGDALAGLTGALDTGKAKIPAVAAGAPVAGAPAAAATPAKAGKLNTVGNQMRDGFANTALGQAYDLKKAKRVNAMDARRADRLANGLFNEQQGGMRGLAARGGNTAWQAARFLAAHPLQSAKIAKKGLTYGALGTAAALALPLPLAGAALATAAGIKQARKLWENRPPANGYRRADQEALAAYRNRRAAESDAKASVKQSRLQGRELAAYDADLARNGWRLDADGRVVDANGVPVDPAEVTAKVGPRPEVDPAVQQRHDARRELFAQHGWTQSSDGRILDADGNEIPYSRVEAVLAAAAAADAQSGISLVEGSSQTSGTDRPDSSGFEAQAHELLSSGAVSDPEALAAALACTPIMAKQVFDRYNAGKTKPGPSGEKDTNPVTGEQDGKVDSGTEKVVTGEQDDEAEVRTAAPARLETAQDISNPVMMLPGLSDFGVSAPTAVLPGLETITAQPKEPVTVPATPAAPAPAQRPTPRPAPTRQDLTRRKPRTSTNNSGIVTGDQPQTPPDGIV